MNPESPAPRRITETDQPPLPCWLWSRSWNSWYHSRTFVVGSPDWQEATHYLPDQPTAPTCVPDALPPSSPQAALGVREETGSTALLKKCFDHLGREIFRMSINESARTGTQSLHLEIAQHLDSIK